MEHQVRYQRQARPECTRAILARPCCERLLSCTQCGTCSGTCPLALYMDVTPRRIVQFVREGFRDDALRSQTIWLCASCYACAVHCPQDIDLTDLMHALKREAIREHLFPRHFPIPALAQELHRMVVAIVGFGAVLYAAAEAETYGWTGAHTLLVLGLGLVVLLAHVFIELRVAKDPMTDLRLFSNPVFLNASLVGYVATIALFGAEFLMPIYPQSFRANQLWKRADREIRRRHAQRHAGEDHIGHCRRLIEREAKYRAQKWPAAGRGQHG